MNNMSAKQVKAYGTDVAKTPLLEITINRRTVQDHDVEFEVLYCGICHSDLHQIKNDFGGTLFPIVPGHEIVGRITTVGEHVKNFKVGDLAGVGCIVDSCDHCEYCNEGIEQFCDEGVTFSFNSPDKISSGHTFGGFSKTYVCNERYVCLSPR